MKVVKITYDNVYTLVPIISKWRTEALSHVEVPMDTVKKELMRMLNDNSYVVFGLADPQEEGEPYVGMMISQMSRYPVWDLPICSEVGWYILPEYRKLGYGKLLLDAAYEWGKKHEAKFFMANIYLGAGSDNGKKACESLQKNGFLEFERVFLKPIS